MFKHRRFVHLHPALRAPLLPREKGKACQLAEAANVSGATRFARLIGIVVVVLRKRFGGDVGG
jgi:hypothetical protein